MRTHTRRFNHTPKRFLAPTPARLVRFEHHAELQRFCGERLTCCESKSELFPHFAEGRRLRSLALLQTLLVCLQLLLQRFDQSLDRLLPLR